MIGLVVRGGRPVDALLEVRSHPFLGQWRHQGDVSGAPVARRAACDQSGRFEVQGLVPGPYEVSAFADDGASGRAVLVLPVDGCAVEVRVEILCGGHVVRGVARVEDGEDYRGPVVAFRALPGFSRSCRDNVALASAWTSTDGSFRFAGLPAGIWRFAAAHQDPRSEAAWEIPGDTTVVVRVSRLASDPDDLPPSFPALHGPAEPSVEEIRGRIVDGRGSPIAGAVVHDRDLLSRTLTDVEGCFALAVSSRGWLGVRARGYGAAMVDGDGLSGAESTITLGPVPTVDCRVVDADTGTPVRDAVLVRYVGCCSPTWLLDRHDPVPWASACDADGRVRLAPFRAGFFAAVAPGYRVSSPKWAEPSDEKEWTLSLERGRDVSGRVVLPRGVPSVHGLQVTTFEGPVGLTDDSGGFLARGLPHERVGLGARLEHGGIVYVGDVDVEPGVREVEIVLAPYREDAE